MSEATEEMTKPIITSEENKSPKTTSKESLIGTTSATGTSQRMSLNASSTEKTSTKMSSERLLSKDSSIENASSNRTLQKVSSKKSFTGKTSKETTLEKASSKEFSTEKTPTKILSRKSLPIDDLQSISSTKEMPASELEKVSTTNADTRRVSGKPTRSNSKNSLPRKSLRKSETNESSTSQLKSPKSEISENTSTKQPLLRESSRKSSLKNRSSKIQETKFDTPKGSIKSSNLKEKKIKITSSEGFFKDKRKSEKSLPRQSNVSIASEINTIRRSIKNVEPVKDRTEDLLRRGSQESTESLDESTYQEGDEDAELTKRLYFIDAFKNIPDINDLSEPSSNECLIMKSESVKRLDEIVNSEESTGSEILDSVSIGKVESDVAFHRTSSDNSSTITLNSLIESEDEDNFLKEKYSKPVEDNLLDFTGSTIESQTKFSDVMVTKIEYRPDAALIQPMNIKFFEGFVNYLINRTVIHCEKYSTKLRRFLDKEKLFTKLYYLVEDYRDEFYKYTKVEKLVTDYYLKKKRFSYLAAPNQRDSSNERRLSDALLEFDRNLKSEKEVREKCQSTISALTEQVREAQTLCIEKRENFEGLVDKTLCKREEYDHLRGLVKDLLRRIEHFRNEMYKMRFALILTQHQFADIKMQSDKMDDLGEGLTVNEYLATEADTVALASKIAEKNGDLKRLTDRVTHDLHGLAHLKCKEQIGQTTLRRMKVKLKSYESSKQLKRKIIHNVSLNHNKITREINDLKSAGYLMHYPALMHDFDSTIEMLGKRRESVAKLREEYDRLQYRIKRVETRRNPK